MRTIYKILNPSIGSYETCDTEEEANSRAKEVAWQFYLSHTHGTPITKVEVTDENYEIWTGTNETVS
jgi:hypothetical protein